VRQGPRDGPRSCHEEVAVGELLLELTGEAGRGVRSRVAWK
jgi:hypothetical protein